ncbi:MAG: zf-HC2 domain-containing protein [Sedimentisphaerales bacterium]
MNCEQCRELLAGYVEDLLEPQQIEAVELHLRGCAGCRAELEQMMTLHNRLIKSCANLRGRDIETAVMDKIVRQQAFELRKTSENNKSRNFWRLVMKNRIAQLAAAAIILIAAGLSIYYFAGEGAQKCCAWGDIVRPIMDANTAEFDVIAGEEGKTPVIHDMVMGSKMRRTMEGMEGVSIIDLRMMRLLTLDPQKKKATYIDLKGLPQMPNYLDHLKDIIKRLQNSPGFVVEELGRQEIDGQILYGFKAKHPQVSVVIYVDPATALPVRIEQEGEQIKVICKNMRFSVPMDETQFSMEAPEGYKVESQELDLLGSTEKDFIEGLRIQAEVLNDGVFPDDVSIEYVVKSAAALKDKCDKLKMTDDEKMALGMKYQKGLMFIRFFKGEGKWIYAGKGVKLGDANTAIFWYRPAGSSTYHVIYGDLSVADVNDNELPKPAENQ